MLAAYLRPKDTRRGILKLDLMTKTVVETPQPAICRFPLFAPHNSREILFTSEEGGVLNVYRLDVDTGTKTAVTRQADSVLITDWREEKRAIGIRQFETSRNEAFALDPYRQPQYAPAELQPYYTNWLKTAPATPMVFDSREVPGQFRGRFRSLSTFRPLGVAPALAMIKNHLAAGVVAVASDMPGNHLMTADVLSDFRPGSRPNGGLSYSNRTTSFDIDAQVGYRDVTTFSFYGPDDDLYEGIWSAQVGLTKEWPLTSRYGTHRLFLGAGAEDSEVLRRPEVMAADSQRVLTEPARDYRIGSVAGVYQFTEVRPYASFPVDAKGAGVSYQYHRSLAGEDFSFHQLWLRGYWMQPFAQDRITLLGTAMLAGQAGTSPAQLRLGMAKYSSGNTLLDYSSHVYIRGGEQYLPGNRQLTTTVELRLPVVSLLEPFAFVDGFHAWGEGTDSAGEETSRLGSAGGGFRLPPVLGSSLETGVGKADRWGVATRLAILHHRTAGVAVLVSRVPSPLPKSRSAAPGWPGATTENTGRI